MRDHRDHDEASREDVLIGRVVDGTASMADWTELELEARSGVPVWERLAATLHAEAQLRAEVDEAIAVADEVDLPAGALSAVPGRGRFVAASGWTAAAALLLAWIVSAFWAPVMEDDAAPQDPPVTLVDSGSPDPGRLAEEYVHAARDAGRIVGLVPARVMQATPSADGDHLEVIYLRGWLERASVNELYEIGEDEQGRPTSMPVSWTKYVSSGPH